MFRGTHASWKILPYFECTVPMGLFTYGDVPYERPKWSASISWQRIQRDWLVKRATTTNYTQMNPQSNLTSFIHHEPTNLMEIWKDSTIWLLCVTCSRIDFLAFIPFKILLAYFVSISWCPLDTRNIASTHCYIVTWLWGISHVSSSQYIACLHAYPRVLVSISHTCSPTFPCIALTFELLYMCSKVGTHRRYKVNSYSYMWLPFFWQIIAT